MPRTDWRRGTALALCALLLSGCLAKQNMRERAPLGEHGTQKVGIDLVNAAFAPKAIEARAGQPLIVELHNKGFTAHTFTVDELHIDVVLDRGQDKTITIPAQPAGTYRFYCRFYQAEGMRGHLGYD